MDDNLRIDLLADHPEAVPLLRAWFEREWAPYYGPDGPGDAERDLLASARRNALPVALVALYDGQFCGTAALKRDSVTTHPHLTPWLAALLVAPAFRGRGIGDRLIAAIEDTARRFGFDGLYAGTGTTDALLVRRGWTFLERVPYFTADVSIYRKRL